MSSPRHGLSGQKRRDFGRLVLRTYGNICCHCGHEIDLTLPRNHRLAFTVEHLVPVVLNGPLLDLDNARPAHRKCNSARGARVEHKVLKTSEVW